MNEQTEGGKIPDGKYTFVGIDIDTTGRRILDEVNVFTVIFFHLFNKSANVANGHSLNKLLIFLLNPIFSVVFTQKKIVHLAAYSPKDQFDQYVIPVMNLNPAARQRHQLRVITVGFFRMLKCTLTNKVLKSKTEIVALKSFLDWLEERKKVDTDSNGIVLIYHEAIKFAPYMLLEALKKYDLLERFSKVVTGFVDGHALTEAKCVNEAKMTTLRDLAKLCLSYEEKNDAENFEGNAMVRARLTYEVVQHFAKGKALLRLCEYY